MGHYTTALRQHSEHLISRKRLILKDIKQVEHDDRRFGPTGPSADCLDRLEKSLSRIERSLAVAVFYDVQMRKTGKPGS